MFPYFSLLHPRKMPTGKAVKFIQIPRLHPYDDPLLMETLKLPKGRVNHARSQPETPVGRGRGRPGSLLGTSILPLFLGWNCRKFLSSYYYFSGSYCRKIKKNSLACSQGSELLWRPLGPSPAFPHSRHHAHLRVFHQASKSNTCLEITQAEFQAGGVRTTRRMSFGRCRFKSNRWFG